MTDSPLALSVVLDLGPLQVTEPVVVTWGLMALGAILSFALTRNLALRPSWPQAVLELIVTTLDSQIRATIPGDPARFRPLIGTLFLFILIANWSSLAPGIEPPTAHLETDAALALIVFVAAICFGVRAQGLRGYLASFARPTWAMVPLNLIEQVTRAFSLMVRLFGNVMSGVLIIGVLLSLAGLLAPIPLMALDLLTGAVQAYIFATLALVFIAAAVEGDAPEDKETRP